jgi:hypothetical protein
MKLNLVSVVIRLICDAALLSVLIRVIREKNGRIAFPLTDGTDGTDPFRRLCTNICAYPCDP